MSIDLKKEELAVTCWLAGNLSYKMHAGQMQIASEIRRAKQRLIVILCSRQFGKSTLGLMLALEDCIRAIIRKRSSGDPRVINTASNVYIIGPSIQGTFDIVSDKMLEVAWDAPKGLITPVPSQNKWIINHSGLTSELRVSGFATEGYESGVSTRRGLKAESIYIEESRNFAPDLYNKAVKGVFRPMTMHTKGSITHLTTPPEDPNHPFVTETIPIAKKRKAFYSFTLDDNPLLTEQEKEDEIEENGGRLSEFVRREYFCEIIRNSQKVIIPSFSSDGHTSSEFPADIKVFTAGDSGGSRDLTFVLVLGYHIESDTMYALGEKKFERGIDTGTFVEETQRLERVWGLNDPLRVLDCDERVRIDLNKIYGHETRAPHKQNKDGALADVNSAFLDKKIVVLSSCVNLIKVLESGEFNKNRTDFKRTDEYGHADGIMALVYGWRMRHLANTQNKVNTSETYYRDTTEEDIFIGVKWQLEDSPTSLVALDSNGKLIAFRQHFGGPESRIDFLKETLEWFGGNHVLFSHDRIGLSDRFRELLYGIDIETTQMDLKKNYASFVVNLLESVAAGTLDLTVCPRLYRDLKSFQSAGWKDPSRDNVAFESIDALLVAHHSLSQDIDYSYFVERLNDQIEEEYDGL